MQGLPNFFSSPFISGTGKAMNFKFCTDILRIDRNKSPLQISGKVAVGVVRTLEIFRAPIYWAHRAVVFAIAQLSCYHSCQSNIFSTIGLLKHNGKVELLFRRPFHLGVAHSQ